MKEAVSRSENHGYLPDPTTTVLLVEDDPTLAALLQEVLFEECGWRVLLASSGEQALQVVQQARPQLFLFDNNLGGKMTGLDLSDCLQAHYAGVPTFLMSAYLPPQETLNAHGVVGIQKPYDVYALLDDISAAVQRTPVCLA